MHMASALVSTAVAVVMGVTSGGTAMYSGKQAKQEAKKKALLMGTAGAMVFSAQMVNFSITGTGSSGHIGGAFLLAFLSMCVILTVQCLLFGDGGLLALGCNIFNMGVIPCFVIYPLVKTFVFEKNSSKNGIFFGAIAGGFLSMVLGSFAVVLQTSISGISELPFIDFVTNMIPIHCAIGMVEGAITGVILLISELFKQNIVIDTAKNTSSEFGYGKLNIFMGAMAFVTGGIFSLFASSHPDGLEWSIINVTGSDTLVTSDKIHQIFDTIQETTALLPNYAFKTVETMFSTSFIGLVGCSIVLVVCTGLAIIFNRKTAR